MVKSITRSGTTFTAKNFSETQLFTFTQQDNNTTYGVATTSANGLMSSGDKSKLDKLKSFNDGKECHISYWRNSNSDGGIQIKGITSDNKIITIDFTPGVIRLQLFNSLSGNAVITKNWYPS